MTTRNGNGGFACEPASSEASIPCPCCGGTLTAAMLHDILEAARKAETREAAPAPRLGVEAMIIDAHAHMISRTTDDYEAMARAGVVAVIEPAFWLGQPRTSADTYRDYLSLITGFERFRAGQFGIRHYCTIGLNPKEANNEELAEAVMEILPRFAVKEGVVAVGELGYDEQTALEDRYLRAQIELAKEYELPIMVHTPHRDKKRGTLRTMDVLAEHRFDPARCVIDHNNEETVEEVLSRGYWVAFSIYPQTKMGNERMTEIVRRYGPERLIVDSACDWGVSDPLAVPKTARLMAERGIDPAAIRAVTYANALSVYGLNGEMREEHWTNPAPIDQRTLYQGNSVLRGGQSPVIQAPGAPATELRIN
ncbi:MAG: TatD-related deoxyribonuclease [Microvirga sp.]|jgi:predicted metal-dependent TIM-barrel fold hydrolase|nr:TatD-related deoxyribonuclease [Microvirga sp.]